MEKSVAAYCRVSTLEQKKKGFGIDIQVRDIQRYADVFSFPINDFYIDEAKSGISENRSELKRLLRDCKTGKVGAIIISSLDRLSRDLRLTENLLYDLQRLGIKVYIVDMPHYDVSNRKDVLIRQIKEAIAEENRKEIIERLKKGREERTRKGLMAGGTLSYGFVRTGKKIQKDRHEVEIIKIIFSLCPIKSGQEIAAYLNEKGYRRRNGSAWTQRQVSAIWGREDLYRNGIIRYGLVEGKNADFIII